MASQFFPGGKIRQTIYIRMEYTPYNETPYLKGTTMTTRSYYYGDGTDHVVQLTEAQANAVLNFRIVDLITDPETNEVYGRVNLSDEEMVHYNTASDILNAYLASNTVIWKNHDIPVLRPVE